MALTSQALAGPAHEQRPYPHRWNGLAAQPDALPGSRFSPDIIVSIEANGSSSPAVPSATGVPELLDRLLEHTRSALEAGGKQPICGFAVAPVHTETAEPTHELQLWTGPSVAATEISVDDLVGLPKQTRMRWRNLATPRLRDAAAANTSRAEPDLRRLVARQTLDGTFQLSSGPMTAGHVSQTLAPPATLGALLDVCAASWAATFDGDPVAPIFNIDINPPSAATPLTVQFW